MEPSEPGLCIDLCKISKSNILGLTCPTILFGSFLFDLHILNQEFVYWFTYKTPNRRKKYWHGRSRSEQTYVFEEKKLRVNISVGR